MNISNSRFVGIRRAIGYLLPCDIRRGSAGRWRAQIATIVAIWVICVAPPVGTLSLGAGPVDFNRQVRPLLAKHCTACHGGVKAAGDVSFTYRDQALHAIEPGKPDESELIRRVKSTDPEEVMPKPSHGPRLADDEIRLLEEWIADGATWSDTWSLMRPSDTPLPSVRLQDWPRVPLDHYILARLEQESLAPSVRADAAEYLRRVTLDLTGLPPTLDQWTRFQAAWARDPQVASEQIVDELLASKHFGERWAAMWLDLARYSDTYGFEKDPHREIWPWRDWVIRAFNQDLPFDQFTIKQLAGDLLDDPDEGDWIATAFHRNTQNNTEGGTDDEEFRTMAVIDRVNTTWVTWQATTFGCVRCHAHPYEPFPHESYYKFLALFNNTDDCDQNDDYPHTRVAVDPTQQLTLVRSERELRLAREQLNQDGVARVRTVTDWRSLTPTEARTSGGQLHVDPQGQVTASGTLPVGVVYDLKIPAAPLSALKIDIAPEHSDPTRWPERGAVISHLQAAWVTPDGERHEIHWKEVIADYLEGPYDPLASLDPDVGGFGGYPVLRGPRWVVFVAEQPVVPPADATWELRIVQGAASNSGTQANTLRKFSLSLSNDPQWGEWVGDGARNERWNAWRQGQAQAQQIAATAIPVMRELHGDATRATRIFLRGNLASKGDLVEPGVPDVLRFTWSKDRPMNRLDYARWLVSDQNPLTARVLANRLWAELFGVGIVETLEDFGASGTLPTHPELLDHLAWRLMRDHRWSIKAFLRELVLSATYRQSAQGADEGRRLDPLNRWYGRGPRVRLTAEMVRDQALVVSGLFAAKQFGPPVFPPQPEGVWNTVYSGATWNLSTGEDRYRRAIYTYSRRTSGYPAMLAFDAPSRDVCSARRVPTNTPLQALVTLNDPAFIEMAQAFAKHLQATATTPAAQIRHGYTTVLLREPSPHTMEVLLRLYDEALNEYRGSSELTSKLGDSPETAALVLVANTLLNQDAALVR